MEFNERLKNLRNERKIQQKDLASVLNYGATAISNYESGRNEPSISDLRKIAEFFNVSMDYLLCVNDVRNPYLKRDYPENFDHLKTLYSSLDDKNKFLADEMLQWLFDRQIRLNSSSELKVAQTTMVYKSKNSSNN